MRAMNRAQCVSAVAAGLWLAACGGDDKKTDTSTADQDAMVRVIEDAGPEADASAGGGGGGGGAGGDVGGTGGDVGGGGGAGGEPAVRDIHDCAQACAVFEDCGRIDVWNGMIDNCLEACAPVADDPRIANFYNCLAVASCENVDACTPPEPPPPTCSDICTAMDACEADFVLPATLPNVGECTNACTDATLGPLMTRCGASVLAGVCDPGDFDRCLLSGLYGDCFEACSRLKECGDPEAEDAVACTLACDDVTRGDALVAHRQTVRNSCIRNANGDCDAIAACGDTVAPEIVGEASIEDLCAANADCPVFAAETCADDAQAVLEGLAENSIDCLVDHMTNACDDGDLFRCFRPIGGLRADCDEHCLIGNLCGLLPAGQTEGVCADLCVQVTTMGTPADQAALEAELQCDEALTCADVTACRNVGGPLDLCRNLCTRLTECGVDAGADCEAGCIDSFAADRARAERACVDTATTCEQVALCVPPAAPPCATLCGLLDPCELGGDDCVTSCDNADLADPTTFIPSLACDASTDRCSGRRLCENGDLSGGVACLAYCRTVGECAGNADANLADCLVSCGAGLPGASGLTFEGARACLEAAGADAACPDLQACLNDVAPDAFCADYCNALDACRLGEGGVEGCITDCQARTGEADYLADAACTLASVRRESGCAAVAACNGIEVPPASPECATICAAQYTCNDGTDVFLCERDCVADAAGDAIRAVCAAGATCDQLQSCLDAPDAPPPACVEGCAAIAGCDALGPDAPFADVAACEADCAGRGILEGPEYAGELSGCLTAAAADNCNVQGFAGCYISANVDPICVETWNAVVSCGDLFIGIFGGGDQNQFYADCMNNLAMDEAGTRMSAECLIDTANMAAGDPAACFGVLACFPGLGM